jgi:hypothetical protein
LEDEALQVKEATKSLRLTGQCINVAMDSLSANMAILDANGVILETNRSWQRFGLENKIETPADTVGLNYLEICDSAIGDPKEVEKAREVADGIRKVIAGGVSEFATDYPCHSPDEKRWCYVRATRMADPDPLRVVVSHEDVTAIKRAEEALRERELELELQTHKLEETNTALRVLLKTREEDKHELEEKVLANVKELITPYLKDLKNAFPAPPLLEIPKSYSQGDTSGYPCQRRESQQRNSRNVASLHERGGLPPEKHSRKTRPEEQEGQP